MLATVSKHTLAMPRRPRPTTLALLLALALVVGCGGGEEGRAPTTSPAGEPAAGEPAAGAPAPNPAMLPRPFSAEEIQQAWGTGLVVVLSNQTPAGVELQRWTVLAADEESVEIEYAMTDAGGEVQGTPAVRRSSWQELAGHGDYPAATTRREAAIRSTPLGELEGWLYTQDDPTAEAVTESFFAHAYPGAPVLMQVTQSGVVTLDMRMTAFTPGSGS